MEPEATQGPGVTARSGGTDPMVAAGACWESHPLLLHHLPLGGGRGTRASAPPTLPLLGSGDRKEDFKTKVLQKLQFQRELCWNTHVPRPPPAVLVLRPVPRELPVCLC